MPTELYIQMPTELYIRMFGNQMSGQRFCQFVLLIFVGWAWQRSFVFNTLFNFYFCRLSLTENCQRPQWTQLTLITWWENQTTNFTFAIQLFWCMFYCILWRIFYRWKSKNPIYLLKTTYILLLNLLSFVLTILLCVEFPGTSIQLLFPILTIELLL